jgi:hypothetical protein
MPTQLYHRKQAQICARLALITKDPAEADRLNLLAMEHLERASDEPINDAPQLDAYKMRRSP